MSYKVIRYQTRPEAADENRLVDGPAVTEVTQVGSYPPRDGLPERTL